MFKIDETTANNRKQLTPTSNGLGTGRSCELGGFKGRCDRRFDHTKRILTYVHTCIRTGTRVHGRVHRYTGIRV